MNFHYQASLCVAPLSTTPAIVQQKKMNRPREWAVLGRLSAMALTRAPARGRLRRETELAVNWGLSRGTLRNYMDAVKLVRALPEAELRSMLFRSSAVAAGAGARWYRRDPQGFVDYLDSLGRPPRILDDRGLLKAERAAREGAAAGTKGRSRRCSIDDQLAAIADRHWLRWRYELDAFCAPRLAQFPVRWNGRLVVVQPKDDVSRLLGIARMLLPDDGGTPSALDIVAEVPQPARLADGIALIEVPRRAVFERYRAEANSIWARALAASIYFPLVVLVLPGPAARRHMLSHVPTEGSQWANHPAQARSDPWRGPWRSRPVMAHPHPQAGIIVVSTTISLLDDLFGW